MIIGIAPSPIRLFLDFEWFWHHNLWHRQPKTDPTLRPSQGIQPANWQECDMLHNLSANSGLCVSSWHTLPQQGCSGNGPNTIQMGAHYYQHVELAAAPGESSCWPITRIERYSTGQWSSKTHHNTQNARFPHKIHKTFMHLLGFWGDHHPRPVVSVHRFSL